MMSIQTDLTMVANGLLKDWLQVFKHVYPKLETAEKKQDCAKSIRKLERELKVRGLI